MSVRPTPCADASNGPPRHIVQVDLSGQERGNGCRYHHRRVCRRLHNPFKPAPTEEMLGTGSAGDLSMRTLLLHSTGVALWIGYGVFRGDWVIIISNAVSL